MNTAGLIHALSKYYNAGFTFLVFNMTPSDTEAAFALSNFFEVQDSGTLVLNFTTPANQKADFSFLDQIKENRSTKVVSLPENLDPNHVLGTGSMGRYASRAVGANFKFLQNIPGVTPQDQFNFVPDDLKPYNKYHVATYAYFGDTPMTTDGRSITGFDVGALVVRDDIRQTLINKISSFLMNNDFVPYNETSINAIRGMEQGTLINFQNRNLIQSYNLKPNTADIVDEIKATGEYKDAGYEYVPMRSIDKVKLSQTLNITKEE